MSVSQSVEGVPRTEPVVDVAFSLAGVRIITVDVGIHVVEVQLGTFLLQIERGYRFVPRCGHLHIRTSARGGLSANIVEVKDFIVGAIGEQGKVDDSLEGELKDEVEEGAGDHHTDHVAETKLKNLVELHEETVWKLTVDQLHHHRRDKGRLEGQLSKDSEDGTAHEDLSKGEPSSEEDKENHVDAEGVRDPRHGEVGSVLGHRPAVGGRDSAMTDKQIGHDHSEAEEEDDSVGKRAVVDEVDLGVAILTHIFVTDAAEVENLHVDVGSEHADCKRVDLEEWLLEQVRKQVPVFFGEGTSSESVIKTSFSNEDSVNDDGEGD